MLRHRHVQFLFISFFRHHSAYWVGKKSLKNWANYVLQGNEAEEVEDEEDTESANSVKERSTDEVKTDQSDPEKLDHSKNETDGETASGGIQMFNEDIVCVHGKLLKQKKDEENFFFFFLLNHLLYF